MKNASRHKSYEGVDIFFAVNSSPADDYNHIDTEEFCQKLASEIDDALEERFPCANIIIVIGSNEFTQASDVDTNKELKKWIVDNYMDIATAVISDM